MAGYSEYNGTSSSFMTRTRAATSGVWGPELAVATPVAPFSLSWVSVGLDGAGNATALWMETDFTSAMTSPYNRRLWTATLPVGFSFGWSGKAPLTDVIKANYSTPSIAVAPSGAAAVDWEIANPTNSAQALYRPAGGSFGPLTPIGTGSGANVSIAPDGDAAISFVGAGNDARVAVLDITPPAINSVTVPATATSGQAVAMSAGVTDDWSGLGAGQPSWAFGDGGTGAGASVSHAFAAPGTFTVTIGARDALGNAAAAVTRQIVVSNAKGAPPPPPPGSGAPTTIAAAKLKATWTASHLVGSVSVSGTVAANATLTLSIRRHGGKKTVAKSTFKAKAGKWTHSVTLPRSLAPGLYDVFVTGTGVLTSQRSFTIAAPKTGIVKRTYATGPRRGPEATTLSGTSELWAHFIFGTLPKKGQTITTQWILPNGSKLAANTRPRTTLIEAQVKDLSGKALPTGRWRCVVSAGGVVVATLSVRLK
jgi:PKD repeat protein